MDINEILARVAKIASVRSDTDIARELGTSPQAIGNARKRGTIPYEKIAAFAVKHGISLEYLLFGPGRIQPIDLELFDEVLSAMNRQDRFFGKLGQTAFSGMAASIYNLAGAFPDQTAQKIAIEGGIKAMASMVLRLSGENRDSFLARGLDAPDEQLTEESKEMLRTVIAEQDQITRQLLEEQGIKDKPAILENDATESPQKER